MIENLMVHYKEILYILAEFSASSLELLGIIIIVVGSVRALFKLATCYIKKQPAHIMIDLGKSLSLALEFKMGAEIINTVVIHSLKELAILGVVIAIRALLAFIVHWEIKTEEKERELKIQKENNE